MSALQLIMHESGIRHYKDGEENTRHYSSITQALSRFKDVPLLYEPGTNRVYSTFGCVLLGVVVEGGSGRSYVDYLSENLLHPAGIQAMRDDDAQALIPHRAHGYRRTDEVPGGGLVATATDLVLFALAVCQKKLVSRNFAPVFVQCHIKRGKNEAGPRGWNAFDLDEQVWFGHPGGLEGFTADLIFDPPSGTVIALMIKSGKRASIRRQDRPHITSLSSRTWLHGYG